MSEKVLREFQIIETDEGFRIELKGDKEQLRHMLFEQGTPFGAPFFMPFGMGRRFRGRHPFGRHDHEHHEHQQHEHEQHIHPHPPFGFRGWKAKRGYDMGPWWDEGPSPDDESAANA